MNRVSSVAHGGERNLDDRNDLGMATPDRGDGDALPYYNIDAEVGGQTARAGLAPVIAGWAVVAGILAWTAGVIYIWSLRGFALPPLDNLPSAIGTVTIPPLLAAILYMQLRRARQANVEEYLAVARTVREESESLDLRLSYVNQQLADARQNLSEQAALLENYGAAATEKIAGVAGSLRDEMDSTAHFAHAISQAGGKLKSQFAEFIQMLPALEKQAEMASSTLSNGSNMLTERLSRLEGRLDQLVNLTDKARTSTLSATQSIHAQLLSLQDSARGASEELSGMAEVTDNRISSAVDRARQAIDETGLALDMRMADLNMLVDTSRSALAETAQRASETLGGVVDDMHLRLRDFNQTIDDQVQVVTEMNAGLTGSVEEARERFSLFEGESRDRNARIAAALQNIAQEADRVTQALQRGGDTASQLITRSESLLLALDASVRELEDTHPAALDRLIEKVENSRALLIATAPEIDGLEQAAIAILARAQEADTLLSGGAQRLQQWLNQSESGLAQNHQQVRSLQDSLQSADATLQRLIDSSGPQLVAALLRVRESADHAAQRAHEALAGVIPAASAQLGQESAAALEQALGERITARIAQISEAAERALSAANNASDRLARQLGSISETAIAIEQRAEQAEEVARQSQGENFNRRSARLIERLNSASIDIAKALSGDVSDASWRAYLKGDRSAFTRRAVRLLDAGQARNMAEIYEGDEAFREQVNRYIHDFEAMLRDILSQPEGDTLGVTLLSSDVGKLYVALAQATDRLGK